MSAVSNRDAICTVLAWCLLASSGAARAAHPLLTDDPGTQGSGNWQLEVNTDHTRSRHDAATTRERALNATLTHGFTETLDLALNVPWLRNSTTGAGSQGGAGDTALLAKWRFLDNGAGWTLGLRPQITLPSGSAGKGLGNGRATASLTLLSSVEAAGWTWLANAGYTYNANQAGDRRHLWAASTAVLYHVDQQWTLAADVGVSRAAEPGTSRDGYGLLGIIYHVGDDIDLDVGWRRSLGRKPVAHAVGAGLTVRW